jgi:hypothetical protein
MAVYPKEYLSSPVRSAPGTCFVLMPFRTSFRKVLTTVRSACDGLKLSCARADDISKAGHIMEEVLRGIVESEYVVADLTGKNPNVFYELGIAHTCKDTSKVIMITQRKDDVPFDLQSMRYFKYRPDTSGLAKLKADLTEAMQGEGYRFSIEKGKQFELADMLSGGRFLYKFRIVEVGFGSREAKFMMRTQKYIVGEGLKQPEDEGQFLRLGEAARIAPTDWQISLDRIEGTPARAFFSISRRAS